MQRGGFDSGAYHLRGHVYEFEGSAGSAKLKMCVLVLLLHSRFSDFVQWPSDFPSGGLQVNEALRNLLIRKLRDSNLDPATLDSIVNNAVQEFELGGKRTFKYPGPDLCLKVGSKVPNNDPLGIKDGIFTLSS